MVMLTMPQVAKVILDRTQEITAHKIGLERAINFNADPKDSNQYGQRFTNYHEFIWQKAEACGAETAVANYFGDYGFTPKVDVVHEEADVGENIEVKWTKHINGHLIIQEGSKARPNDVAILVTGFSPVYILLGWMPISMATQPRYKHPHQNNYWIPRASLFEMQYLKRSNYGV
jgi:hypothetical protein